MKKLSLFLTKCFYVMFLIFPLGFGICASGWVTINALMGKNIVNSGYFRDIGFQNPVLCTVIAVVLLAGLYVLTFRYGGKLFEKHFAIAPVLGFVLALIPRLTLFFVFRSVMTPYSDGRYAWYGAQGTAPERLAVKVLQNGWNNFTGLLRYLITNFNIEYTTFMFFVFVADALIAVAVYFIAVEIIQDKRAGFIAAALYALNPSILAREFYMSPDIIAQLGVAVAVLLLIKMFREKKNLNIVFYALLAGCSAGLANGFKSVARVLVVAVFIVAVIKLMQDGITVKRIVPLLLSFVVFTAMSLGINKVGLKCSSYVLGTECRDLNTWHFINVGLNPYGGGLVSHGEGHYYNHLITAGVDPDEARGLLFEKLAKDWSEADITVAEFTYGKARTAWRNDIRNFSKQMFNSVEREKMNQLQHSTWQLMLATTPMLSQLWHTVTMLLALLGTLHIFIKRLENSGAFLISLHTFGFALMLLISEVQARYKSNIIHLIAVLAAIGLWRIYTRKNSTDAVDTDTEKEKVRS